MNKKITIELTQEEYDAIAKTWEQAKNSPIMPSKALNFDDFCKEVLVMFSKGPDFGNIKDTLESLKNINIEDFISQLNDIDQIKEMMSGKKKPDTKPEETKKDSVPDDQKYKS